MAFARRVLFSVFVLAFAACKGRSGAASLGAVPVVAPFAAMQLPIGQGVVWQCNAARMKVVYDGGDKSDLGDRYGRALAQHGWSPAQAPAGATHQWLARYEKSRETLTLDVHDADFRGKVPGGVEVFLAISDAP